MQQADDAARELRLSRSALVAQALRDFLRQRHRAQITEQLNRAYDESSPAGGWRSRGRAEVDPVNVLSNFLHRVGS